MGPEYFLQSHLLDWMHEVMHKDKEDWEYNRGDLRFSPFSFVKATTSSFMPFGLGLKYLKAPTLERLERVNTKIFLKNHSYFWLYSPF